MRARHGAWSMLQMKARAGILCAANRAVRCDQISNPSYSCANTQPTRLETVRSTQLRSLTGGSYEKVLARKRGACGDARWARKGGGHAGATSASSGRVLRLDWRLHRRQRRRRVVRHQPHLPCAVRARLRSASGRRGPTRPRWPRVVSPVSRPATATASSASTPVRRCSGAPGCSVQRRR